MCRQHNNEIRIAIAIRIEAYLQESICNAVWDLIVYDAHCNNAFVAHVMEELAVVA